MLGVSELQGEAAMSTTPAASAQSTVRLPTPQVAPELALESTLRRRAAAPEFRGAYRYRPHEHCMDLARPVDRLQVA